VVRSPEEVEVLHVHQGARAVGESLWGKEDIYNEKVEVLHVHQGARAVREGLWGKEDIFENRPLLGVLRRNPTN